MAGYTEKDLERAFDCLEACGVGTDSLKHINAVAQLIADVRNETIERCAVELDDKALHNRMAHHDGAVGTLKFAAGRIRALKDGAK